MALLAFAAECQAAVCRAASALAGHHCRAILPARRAHSTNLPHAAAAVNGTDRQMNRYRYTDIDPAARAVSKRQRLNTSGQYSVEIFGHK